MALVLDPSYIDEMIAHARADAPNECCGIIAGKDGRATRLYRMRNVSDEALKPYRYEMSGKDLLVLLRELEPAGEEFFVIYHSHTATEAQPSPTDVRFASNWPDPFYVLVSLMDERNPVVRAFRIVDGVVNEESIDVRSALQ